MTCCRLLIVQAKHIGGLVEGVLGAAEGGRAQIAISEAADAQDLSGWRQNLNGMLTAPGLVPALPCNL